MLLLRMGLTMKTPLPLALLSPTVALTATALLTPLLAPSAHASNRAFAYTYQSLTAPIGEIELENKATWKSRPGQIREFAFQHELELGISEKTQLALYIASGEYDARARGGTYQSSGLEIIHNFTHPSKDVLGSAILGEIQMGDRALSLEGKLILDKKFGPWVIAWNGEVAAEWEGRRMGDFREPSGELAQSLGISYEITKNLALGAEVLNEVPLGAWHGPANAEWYAGPNITARKGHFYATLTTLFQTTDRKSAPGVQMRTIVGFEF